MSTVDTAIETALMIDALSTQKQLLVHTGKSPVDNGMQKEGIAAARFAAGGIRRFTDLRSRWKLQGPDSSGGPFRTC